MQTKHVRTGPAPSPAMPARPMPHVGGGAGAPLPLDDGRPLDSHGPASREQPYGHVVQPYDECSIRPLGARVILRLVPDDDLSPSGLLVVPAAAKNRPTRGRVVAVGPGRELPNGTRVPAGCQPGDLVYFRKWAEVPVFDQKNQDRTLVAVSQEEILCVVEQVADPAPIESGALTPIESGGLAAAVFRAAQRRADEAVAAILTQSLTQEPARGNVAGQEE